jgi:uncharacterized membrane protein
MKKALLYYSGLFVLAFIVSLPLILPYFKTGYFPTHDGEWAVVRLSDMYREVKDLQFPARYSGYLNFQFGYPLFNFTYPLPYYVGLIFVFLKSGFLNSIKILFSLSVILSFFSMFVLSKSLWKDKWAALISSVLYVYVPYRIIDLYVRGSIGESLSFVLFPLILLGIKRVYEKGKVLNIALVGFLYALLITTHNIMAVLFGIILLFILIASLIKKRFTFLLNLLLALIFSLCLSAFFWIPALAEKNLIILSKIPIADRSLYFVNLSQLIIPKWGYGTPTDINAFSYQIGIPQIITFVLVLALVILKRKTKEAKIGLFLILSTAIISLLMFPFSSFIWSHAPLLSEINYPWTILAIVMFLISLSAGYLAKIGKTFCSIGLILAVLAIIMFIGHARPQSTVNRGDDFYLTNQATTTSSNELMPLWVKKQPIEQPNKKIETKSGEITNLYYNSKKISFMVNLPDTQIVRINTIYYPGWNIFVDGTKTQADYSNQLGVMDIKVSKGQHSVVGSFTETPIRLIADIISLLSFLFLIYLLTFKSKLNFF